MAHSLSNQPKLGKKYVMVSDYPYFCYSKAISCEKSHGEVSFALSPLAAKIWATEKREFLLSDPF